MKILALLLSNNSQDWFELSIIIIDNSRNLSQTSLQAMKGPKCNNGTSEMHLTSLFQNK